MNRHRFILFLLLGAFLGASTTRAATSDYRVVAWGYNRYGETNVPVAAQSGVTGIAAGFQRTVVLKKDGSVFVWGWNFAGQTNVPVEAQSGVTAIAAGWEHTVALKSDGSVVAWGDNSSGQTTVPAGLRRVSAISAGAGHTVALKSDGTVTAWGLNDGGQTSVPGGLSGVTAIATGWDHTVVIQTCPLILSQPSDALVFIGSDAIFSVSATTDDPPLRYQWRRGTISLTNIVLNSRTCSFTLSNVQTNSTSKSGPGSYRVAIASAAGAPMVLSIFVTLTVNPATPPALLTGVADQISSSAATFNGSVNPNGSTTTARFEYGLTDNYSNSTPVLAIGNGTNAVSVSSLVTGLIAATDYHFRLVASNSGGTNYGADQSFTTITSLPAVPSLLSPGWGLGRFSVSVVTETGATYHLERKNSLSDPEWVTVSIVSGNGLARSLSDQGATDAQSFYRVRVE